MKALTSQPSGVKRAGSIPLKGGPIGKAAFFSAGDGRNCPTRRPVCIAPRVNARHSTDMATHRSCGRSSTDAFDHLMPASSSVERIQAVPFFLPLTSSWSPSNNSISPSPIPHCAAICGTSAPSASIFSACRYRWPRCSELFCPVDGSWRPGESAPSVGFPGSDALSPIIQRDSNSCVRDRLRLA